MPDETEHKDLTHAEQVYYANHQHIDTCDVCKEYVRITNTHEGYNFLTLTGTQYICQKCLSEPPAETI